MEQIIYLENSLTLPPANRKEILRYAGTKTPTAEVDALLSACITEVENELARRVCYCLLPVQSIDGGVLLGETRVFSKNLATALGSCKTAVLFAATIGLSIDRLIAKYTRISPAKALLIEAVGNERIEALCDAFQQKISAQYGGSRPRFSPGYGDLPLDFQREVFRLLDCSRKIGLTLNESLLMTPAKSVTALFGINEI